MTGQARTSLEEALPAAPYVGVRPFERDERAIFFGRERDAALLRDKVWSARLTILYGGSGTGKSSLLRTLLIPRLEEQGARVLHCDAWRGEDPAATLRAKLVEEAVRLEIPDPDAGAPSLIDLIRLVQSVDGRTLVLILDQFEELFTVQGTHLEPLRKGLGGIVRASGVDVRVLISLREEHLAALEPFKQEVLNLFQSTYRLLPLSAKCVREAIERPLELFGASAGPGLVEELERELSREQKKTGPPLGAEEQAADLPMLQLVCDELWRAARKREERTLSLGLYRELGGRRGILEAYLGRVMPHAWNEQRLTARLLRYLAPQNGHKVSYSAEDLASLASLPLVRVGAELERLTEARVLRTRQYGAGGVLYELWHDSFIHILTPWRDRVLKRDKVWRWSRNAAGVLLVVLVAVSGVLWWQDREELRENTQAVWADPNRSIEQKFDQVASYLLWARRDLERLQTELVAHETLLPSSYGLDDPGRDFVAQPGREEDWPLTVSYSSARALDPNRFTQVWQEHARHAHEEWGIPLPARVKLLNEDAYPKQVLRLTGSGLEPVALELPANEQDVLLSEGRLSDPGREFLSRFEAEWTSLPTESGIPFWIVPRWSLPAWKASGGVVTDGSGLPAFLLMRELWKSPERMLPPEAVEALLAHASTYWPATVAEVRAVRGERLTEDLRELIRQGVSLKGLPLLLNLLADHPEGSSAESVTAVIAEMNAASAGATGQLHGPHAARRPGSEVSGSPSTEPPVIHPAYQEVMPTLSAFEGPIRVYLGQRLVQEWVTRQDEVGLELNQRILAVRTDMLRRFGIDMPGVKFRSAEQELELPPDAFRIVMLKQTLDHPEAVTVQVEEGTGLERLEAALAWNVEKFRGHFLTTEDVDEKLSALKESNAGLHSWLVRHYSRTDLKRLLRAVIVPSPEELAALDERWRMMEAGKPGGRVQEPLEKNAHHPAWLLGSLVFWSKLHDPYSLEALAEALRDTQHARVVRGPPPAAENAQVAKRVEAGIRALDAGRLPEAEAAFSQAIRLNPRAAVSSFLASYPRRLHSSRARKLAPACEPFQTRYDPEGRAFLVFQTPVVSPMDRAMLEELLSEGGVDTGLEAATARRLRLCLLATDPEPQGQKRRVLAEQLQERYGPPERWPADDAAWFGLELLEDFDPLSDDSSAMRQGLAYLESGFRRLERTQALRLHVEVRELCMAPGSTRWCWNHVVPALAGAREEPSILLDFAFHLAERDVRADVERALTLVAKAKERLRAAKLPARERQELLDWAEFTRALALDTLTYLGAREEDAEVEAILLRLQGSPHLGAQPALRLATSRMQQSRFEEASAILDMAMEKWPEEPQLYHERLQASLLRGDTEGVARVAGEAFQRVGLEQDALARNDLHFVAALGLLVTGTDPWAEAASQFLKTEHDYVPYVAMMLYPRMPEASRDVGLKVLQKLWAQAEPLTWRERLREGDATAWREMLIGYYLGEVPREQIFAELEGEERFARSELSNVMMSRLSMLCEAYFYDALLAETHGDTERRNSSLEKTVATGQTRYYEYAMARFLLAQQGVGGSPPE